MNDKIGFIGAGKMASAIIKGIIGAKSYKPSNILIHDLNKDALDNAKKDFGITIEESNINVVKNADVIVFAVKPFVLPTILEEIKHTITKNKVVISIAAGIATKTMEEKLGEIPIIRIMPNTPALVNEGMSAVCKGKYAKDEHAKIALTIFGSVGKVIELDEKYLDIVTGISGSGPAFYYYIINEIAKAGEKLGLDYETCLKLSAQTAFGSAKMMMETGVSPEQLIINVTTPGGTTEVGNNVLKQSNISDILYDTIKGTTEKSKALGAK
ncbi:MAG: pyrroline-5-carboxylate reductase [Candidatus Gastranaerophilales bacterium]|nr:pyrroline-5-carboxylate reductase [Candidatus Gastranaerophilales bacterium]